VGISRKPIVNAQSRENKSLGSYMREIGSIALITKDEECELSRRIQEEDDKNALEKLVKANLKFVVTVAKEYLNQGLQFRDLINEGNLGLIKACYRFDGQKGYKFISYAVWWIRQSIMDALSLHSRIVRLPLNKVGDVNRMEKVTTQLFEVLERDPEPGEIAAYLDISEDEVSSTRQISARHVSLDAATFEGPDNSQLMDNLPDFEAELPDAGILSESLIKEIKLALKTVRPREAVIVKLYYGIDHERSLTLSEIGDMLDLSRERVRQLKELALKKLRRKSNIKKLRKYLG